MGAGDRRGGRTGRRRALARPASRGRLDARDGAGRRPAAGGTGVPRGGRRLRPAGRLGCPFTRLLGAAPCAPSRGRSIAAASWSRRRASGGSWNRHSATSSPPWRACCGGASRSGSAARRSLAHSRHSSRWRRCVARACWSRWGRSGGVDRDCLGGGGAGRVRRAGARRPRLRARDRAAQLLDRAAKARRRRRATATRCTAHCRPSARCSARGRAAATPTAW